MAPSEHRADIFVPGKRPAARAEDSGIEMRPYHRLPSPLAVMANVPCSTIPQFPAVFPLTKPVLKTITMQGLAITSPLTGSSDGSIINRRRKGS